MPSKIITYISRKEVFETDGVAIFYYALNQRAIKMFEFGAFFLLIVATLIYPVTQFEPRPWMAATLGLAVAATAAFATARYWRMFVSTEFIAWDKDHFYVTQGHKGVAVIPWNVLNLDNTGLKDPTSGSVLNVHVSPHDPIVKLRLVAGFIIIDKFQNVLATILTHIKQNMENKGTPETAPNNGMAREACDGPDASMPSDASSATEGMPDKAAVQGKGAETA